jgi:Putative peptidoglycan binding domain
MPDFEADPLPLKGFPMPMLFQGSRGPDVELAQAALNFHAGPGDPSLVVDGDFGNATKGRTVALQRLAGLNPDGIIGPDTEAVLFASVDVLAMVRVSEKRLDPRRPFTTRSFGASGDGPLLPPLTLPGLGGLRPLPQLIPKLTLSMPLGPGQSTTLPPRAANGPTGESVDLFTIKVKLLKDIKLKLNGQVEASTDLDGSSKIETTSKAEVGIFSKGILSVDAYLKAKAELDPSNANDASIKAGGGLRFTITAGRVTVETSLGVDVLKFNPGSGEAKAGLIWIGGTVDLIRF